MRRLRIVGVFVVDRRRAIIIAGTSRDERRASSRK
jgi:hypothetical protein